jgi:FHA domain-containing protein
MPLQIDSFLLILRLLLIVLLYLFLMQVVLAITRDLGKSIGPKGPAVLGNLVVVDTRGQCIIPVGKSYPLSANTTIGRGPINTIQLEDSSVSIQHARLSYHNDQWYVQDAGSSNGTYINRPPASDLVPIGDKPVAIGEGNKLYIGNIAFLIKR